MPVCSPPSNPTGKRAERMRRHALVVLLVLYSSMSSSLLDLCSFCRSLVECARQGCRPLHSHDCSATPPCALPSLHGSMKQFSAEAKQHILLEYRAHSPTHSFPALAERHGIGGGADTVRKWHARWDGTPQSMQHRAVSGRPRALSRREVQQQVRAPILRANRTHRAVHYTQLVQPVREKTGKQVSLRREGSRHHHCCADPLH
jgi:transposase